MEQFLSYFIFDQVGVICLSTLIVILLIQTFFYLFYYNKPVSYSKESIGEVSDNKSHLPSVSVVIVVKNDSENLAKNLPFILNQNYPNYEVIVVNDGSTDESEFVLKHLKREYSYLYSTFSPSYYDNESHRQRALALTIGIKAATKDVLLFTEVDTCPVGNEWISSMMKNLRSDKDIVLGYCCYKTEGKGFWKKIARFDNLLFSLQYLSRAIRNKPYTGIYRNVAYRKKIFFDNKGFSSSLKYDSADEIFLNQIMTDTNTTVALDKSSFVSCSIGSFSLWEFIKVNYMAAKKHFRNFTPSIFHLEVATRYLFYLLFIGILAYTSNSFLWVYLSGAILLFMIRFLIQYIILKKSAKHFDTSHFLFSLPLIDIIQPYYNSFFHADAHKKRKR